MATIVGPDVFDNDVCQEAVDALRNAMKGLGTSEDVIIEVLVGFTNEQRQEIRDKYKQNWGRGLIDELQDELGGHFKDAVMALMYPPRVFDAMQLRGAIKGGGTTESTLVEILCARSNDEIEQIKEEYHKLEDEPDLETDIDEDCSGHFQRMLISLVNADREDGRELWGWDQAVDYDQAVTDATNLFEAGQDQLGTDESEFARVLCMRSPPQLKVTFEVYEELEVNEESVPIEEAIKSEVSGPLEDGFLAIVDYVKDHVKYFAKRLRASLKGAGTADCALIRIIVGRSEIDLELIKDEYAKMYEESLLEDVAGDCSGDYRDLLKKIIDPSFDPTDE